jgi:hypothetical protein
MDEKVSALRKEPTEWLAFSASVPCSSPPP